MRDTINHFQLPEKNPTKAEKSIVLVFMPPRIGITKIRHIQDAKNFKSSIIFMRPPCFKKCTLCIIQ